MRIIKIVIALFLVLNSYSQCPPDVQVSILSQTLNCYNSTLIATGTSTTPNTQISWIVPSTPSLINSSTVIIGPPNGPPTSSITFSYANYTIIATNTAMACSSTSVITINQNFRPPFVLQPFFVNTNTVICNSSYIGISAGGYVSPGLQDWWINPCWQVPPPSTPTCGVASYNAYYAGTYSLTMMDMLNGCYGTKTISVIDSRPQFGLSGIAPSSSVSCDGSINIFILNPNEYTFSASSGSLNGNTINNLCYGWIKVCVTNTATGCVKCDSLLMSATTSLNEYELEKSFLLYPNPSNSFLIIQNLFNTTAKINIIDIKGRLIEKSELNSQEKIEIKSLDEGIYFIEIKTPQSLIRKKAVVIR